MQSLRPDQKIAALFRLALGAGACACGLSAASAATAATDANAGRDKAALCAACHGPDGRSANDEWPNLAGQKTHYLIRQLRAFRDGGRVHPLMTGIAKMLSDGEMENLAAYYSGLGGPG